MDKSKRRVGRGRVLLYQGAGFFSGTGWSGLAPISGCLVSLGDSAKAHFRGKAAYPSGSTGKLQATAAGYSPSYLQAPNFALRLSVASMTVSPILCHFDWC